MASLQLFAVFTTVSIVFCAAADCFSLRLWPPGGLSRGRGLDPLTESRGLAPLQEHLPGVVRHGACGRPVQRCRHGSVRLRHPALRLRAHGWEGEQRRKESQRGKLG